MPRLTEKQREAILEDGATYDGALSSVCRPHRHPTHPSSIPTVAVDVSEERVLRALQTQALIDGLNDGARQRAAADMIDSVRIIPAWAKTLREIGEEALAARYEEDVVALTVLATILEDER